jgi:acyl-CoA thioesterase II
MDTEAAARALVGVERAGDEWIGRAPEWSREIVFGGVLMGQTVFAATRALLDERRVHSMHMYFLWPAHAALPINYRVSPVRDGRSFMTCRVEAHQDGKDVLTAMCSFASDGDAYDYESPVAHSVPDPSTIETMFGFWLVSRLGPTKPDDEGTVIDEQNMGAYRRRVARRPAPAHGVARVRDRLDMDGRAAASSRG